MTPADRQRLKARNLELFKRFAPAVHKRLTAVRPRWRVDFGAPGGPVLMDGERSVLGAAAPAAGGYKAGTIIRFAASPPDRDRIDAYAFRFLDGILRRAGQAGIRFFDAPAAAEAHFLVIFGIGLGRHVQPLIDKAKAVNVILVEPDIEFLWHSLEVCDWLRLIDGVQKRGGNFDFVLTDDANQISGNIWRTLRKTNPCLADGFMCCVHHHGDLVGRVMADLQHDVALIAGQLGFFYDETLMLWNVHQNMDWPGAKLYRSTPDARRRVPAFVVGSGPSLDGAIAAIRKHAVNAVVISCGSALRPLMTEGIRPDFHIELENFAVSPVVAQVAEAHDLAGLTLIAASTLDPAALKLFSDVVFYFRSALSPYPLFSGEPENSLQFGSMTVANAGLSFAQQAGFRDIYLFGVDMGARVPTHHHAKDTYHFTPGAQALDPAEFRIPVAANFGGTCLTTRGLYAARVVLAAAIGEHAGGRRHFNCSDGAAIAGAEPTRPEAVSIEAKAGAKEKTAVDIVGAFRPFARAEFGGDWPGPTLARHIDAYAARVADCVTGVGDFRDKGYMMRLMGVFQPELGYVHPPPKDPATAVNFLFRGTLIGMLVFFEFYLLRVSDPGQVDRFGAIAMEEFLKRLDELKTDAIDRLAGPAPKEPPPLSRITAAAGERLADPGRIGRNDPCPCGSGRKYKHCHGAVT
jgi:hypothetical protein